MRIGVEISPQLSDLSTPQLSEISTPQSIGNPANRRKSSVLDEGSRTPKLTARSDITDTPRNRGRSRGSSVLTHKSIRSIISRRSIQSNSFIGRNISSSFSGGLSNPFGSNPRLQEMGRRNSIISNRAGFLHHNVDWHLRSSAYTPPEVPLEEKIPKAPIFSFSSNAHHSIFLGIKTTEFRSAVTDNEYCAFKRSGYNIPLCLAAIILIIVISHDFNNRVVAVVYSEPLFITSFTAILLGISATLCFAFNMFVVNTIGIENSSFKHFHIFSETLFHSRYGQVLENTMIVSVTVSVSLYMLGVVVATGCDSNNPLLYYDGCGHNHIRGWIPQEELMFINLSVLLGQVNLYINIYIYI
jgi:hypothetical protein